MKALNVAFATVLLACAGGLALAQSEAGDAARGAALFEATGCAGCHGTGARGAMGPSLLGPEFKFGGDRASMAKSIKGGHLPMMPPMGSILNDGQIADIISYLHAEAASLTPEERARLARPLPQIPAGVVHSALEDFRVDKVAKVAASPYAFDFLPDGRILITETLGGLRIVDKGRLLPDPVAGTPVGNISGMTTVLRRGLLSVAVHPAYKVNGWIYLVTVSVEPKDAKLHAGPPAWEGDTQVATITRGRIKGNRWVDSEVLTQFRVQEPTSLRMKFDRQNHLFIGVPGSEGFPSKVSPTWGAQNLGIANGKILRMNDDGTIPADNPFVGQPGAAPYIWSYGHREPVGLTFDGSGELWEVEDGPRGGDELNHVIKGRNYGWPVATWGHPYDSTSAPSNPDMTGTEQPKVAWVPAPAVLDVEWYGGAAFPRWRGSFFVGTGRDRNLLRVVADNDGPVQIERILHKMDRIRDVATGPDGLLYILADSGDLLRLRPAKARR